MSLKPSQVAEMARRNQGPGETHRMLAKAYQVGLRSIEQACKIAREAPELSDEVHAGAVSLTDAISVLQRPLAMRQEALALVHSGDWPTLKTACAVLSGADPDEVRLAHQGVVARMRKDPKPVSEPELAGRVRDFLKVNPGCGARIIAEALGVTPAAVQDAAWAEDLKVWGLPNPADMLEDMVQYGQTTMFEGGDRQGQAALATDSEGPLKRVERGNGAGETGRGRERGGLTTFPNQGTHKSHCHK